MIPHLEESIALKQQIRNNLQIQKTYQEATERTIACLKQGHKLIFAGNGGSAADAQHLAAELVVRFKKERRSLPALALTTDSSILTATANDYSYHEVFSRQFMSMAQPGDVFFALSTSGNSPNILRALETSKELGITSIGLSGRSGGEMQQLTDLQINIPSDSTARIQECHMLIGHSLCHAIDEVFA